jgi:hypothetical protein
LDSPNLSQIGHFVGSIKRELSLFKSSCVVHVFRKSNSTAHAFATEAAIHHIDPICMVGGYP